MLQVPDRFVKALKNLQTLSDQSFGELSAALSRIPLSATRDELTAEIGALTPSIKPKDLEDFLTLLVSLKSAQEQSEVSADFVSDVLVAMARANESLELAGRDRDKFRQRLSTLLETDRFAISAKAIGLIGESEHTFCRARILTDFRPIYGNNPNEQPVAGLITHTLRLSYHEGTQLRHLYVLLDDSDLKELNAVLSRADIKSQSLRSLLAATRIPLIGTDEKRP